MIRKYQQPQQAAHTQLPSVKRLYFLGSRIVSDFAITTTGCSDGSCAGRYKTLPADGGRHHRRRRRRHVYDVKFPFVCLFAFFKKKKNVTFECVNSWLQIGLNEKQILTNHVIFMFCLCDDKRFSYLPLPSISCSSTVSLHSMKSH